MAKKGSTAGQKGRYAAYKAKDNVTKNAKRKLERHLKKHPNDTQGKNALEKGVGRTRKTPNTRLGWVSEGVKDALAPATVTRTAARLTAQALAHSAKLMRMQLTKPEQELRKKALARQESNAKRNKKA
jgi:hypothetical protein